MCSVEMGKVHVFLCVVSSYPSPMMLTLGRLGLASIVSLLSTEEDTEDWKVIMDSVY